jgi:hypothetical protein
MSRSLTLVVLAAVAPCRFARFRGDYVWLRGADERFLVHRPP